MPWCSSRRTATTGPASPAAEEDTWVFPFDKPLPPAEGDNQALAVAKDDGSVTYDLAFALVWADGDEVLNVNEAHAYASCSDCVAVAVAFQVVLIMDDAQVVVPQNLAVSANYDCYRCITAAIASQLVLSVTEEAGEEDLRALGEVWSRLIEFAQEITHALTHRDHRGARCCQGRDRRDSRVGADDGPGEHFEWVLVRDRRRGDRHHTPAEDGSGTGTPASSEPAPEQEDTPADPPTEEREHPHRTVVDPDRSHGAGPGADAGGGHPRADGRLLTLTGRAVPGRRRTAHGSARSVLLVLGGWWLHKRGLRALAPNEPLSRSNGYTKSAGDHPSD